MEVRANPFGRGYSFRRGIAALASYAHCDRCATELGFGPFSSWVGFERPRISPIVILADLIVMIVALAMSAYGTKRTIRLHPRLSAIGVERTSRGLEKAQRGEVNERCRI